MSRREIPDFVRLRQAQASDPSAAVFVAAHAGSGKTHVLAQRVIRLMLDGDDGGGVDPSKILCITFTKAAAANMAARVYATLKNWIALDDGTLDSALRDIGVTDIDAGKRARARRLFAAALETPGGLKVQTIHGFCANILRQFPFEANVAARFTVLEDRQQSEMLERAILSVLLDAAAVPESSLGRALKVAVASAADSTFRELVREAAESRDKLKRWVDAAGSLDAAIAQLGVALGLSAGDNREAIEKEIAEGPHLPMSEWASVAALYGASSPKDQAQCAHLDAALASEGSERIEHYLSVFFNGENEPRDKLITAALAKKHPQLAARLTRELARLTALVARRSAAICRDRTAALLAVAVPVIKRYTDEKERRGLIDYDDLIDKTYELMTRVHPSWVHYKLDLGLDHVLIDEAQDTSEKQWAIVKQLVAEFAAGAGARGLLKRTIFAVGDEKQSIFSFQGAAPRQYEAMRRHFQKAYAISEVAWRDVRLDFSFRSGENVLGAVDEVFKPQAVARSVTTDLDGVLPHLALPGAVPGLVEIWPLIEPDAVPQPEAWDAPFDELPRTSPQQKLALKIAATVRDLVAAGTPVGAKRQPMGYGDVLVLVRQRGPLFEAIIRAMKNAGVAVAGADRLKLTEHIAIVDLMALADALLLPQDDLALAIALKSPLFGFDDDRLFALAWQRRGSLRAALAARAAEAAEFDAADALLRRAAARARWGPFEFFAWLLGPEQGRRRIFARLGLEAADALDEFLELALDYERSETPSLQGFMAWLRAQTSQVKRDMEVTRNEVRVMTVHGAKGLEAPIVILADTTTPPQGAHPPRLLEVPPYRAPPGAPPCIAWAGRKADDCAALANARAVALAENENEYRRLLYVAMTRAAERLIVAGYRGVKAKPAGCWYDLVFGALSGKPGLEQFGSGDARLWRYRAPSATAPQPQSRQTQATMQLALPFETGLAPQSLVPLQPALDISNTTPAPAWLFEPAPVEARMPTALSPSRAHETREELVHSPAALASRTSAAGSPPAHIALASVTTGSPQASAATLATTASAKSSASRAPERWTPRPSAPEVERAMLRGVLFHRLMQSLPDVPAARREEVGNLYLARAGAAFSAEERSRFLAQALAVFVDPRFAPLFASGSRAEVPIIGRLALPGRSDIRVSGQIDRLVVTTEAVLIGDYKTNRDPPRDLVAAPRAYVDQLAIYRGVLAHIYPDRPIRCVLVWTEIPDLMELPPAMLDEALAAIQTSPLTR